MFAKTNRTKNAVEISFDPKSSKMSKVRPPPKMMIELEVADCGIAGLQRLEVGYDGVGMSEGSMYSMYSMYSEMSSS